MSQEYIFELYSDPQGYVLTITFEGVRYDVTTSRSQIYRGDDSLRIVSGDLSVAIPTTAISLDRFRSITRTLRRSRSSLFAKGEMVSVGMSRSDGRYVGSVEALVWRSVDGITLEEYLGGGVNRCDVEALVGYYRLFDATLRRYDVVVDLSLDALIIDLDGRIYPRYIDAITVGQIDTFALRCAIEECCSLSIDSVEEVKVAPYPTVEVRYIGEYRICGYPHEGLIRVCDKSGLYGFLDESGYVKIPPQYLSAEDFRESRCVVNTTSGWGIINLWGDNIIPPIYDSVGYNETTGTISVRRKNEWGYFSIIGDQLTAINQDSLDESR